MPYTPIRIDQLTSDPLQIAKRFSITIKFIESYGNKGKPILAFDSRNPKNFSKLYNTAADAVREMTKIWQFGQALSEGKMSPEVAAYKDLPVIQSLFKAALSDERSEFVRKTFQMFDDSAKHVLNAHNKQVSSDVWHSRKRLLTKA
jgi:hypothetical protein